MNFNLKSEDINYIKISYKNNNGENSGIKIFLKNIADNKIYAFAKTDDKINIPAPQNVQTSFACKDGLYKAECSLLKTEFDEPYTYFTLKCPQEINFQQNREFFRVFIKKRVTISYQTDFDEKQIECETYDLSANGLKVRLSEEISFPKDGFISIFFENKTIKTKAEYVRSDTDDGIIKASFRFVNLNSNDMDFISQICIKNNFTTDAFL